MEDRELDPTIPDTFINMRKEFLPYCFDTSLAALAMESSLSTSNSNVVNRSSFPSKPCRMAFLASSGCLEVATTLREVLLRRWRCDMLCLACLYTGKLPLLTANCKPIPLCGFGSS